MNARAAAALVWFVLSAVALIAPVYTTLGNRIDPRVLGLPFSLVYVLLVVAANTFVLAWLYIRRVVDDEEPDPP